MRPLKFRAWDEEAKDFDFFDLGEISDGYVGGTMVLDGRPIEQFSELTDTTGKEIYDGDIVTAPWHWEEPHLISLPLDYYAFDEFAISDEMTILGNIHENPELLERK